MNCPPQNITANGICITSNGDQVVTFKWFEFLFGNVVQAVLALGGIALFVMLVVGGFQYITAGGNPQGIEAARKTLTYAILGIVLLAASFLILVLIKDFTGVDVTTFQVVH